MNRFYVPFLLVSFAVQLVILIATAKRFRPLRFAVPILAGVASIIAVPQYCSFALKDSEGIILLFGIFAVLTAIIFWLILASLVLAGWGLAWLAYYLIYYLIKYLIKRIRAHKSQL